MTKALPNISQYFFLVNVIDPTKTITLRQRFVRDMNSRFFRLMADVKEAIVDLDVFGLKKEAVKVNASGLSTGAFDFPTNSRKIDAFTEWMDSKAREYILAQGTSGMRLSGQIVPGMTDIEAARKVWINTYLDSAYQQGIRRARQELRKAGVEIDEGQMGGDPIKVAFNGPIHADRVGMIYTRAYTSLKGITAEMESAVSDVLAMGLAEGRGPKQIARILDKTITGRGEDLGIVDKLGRRIDSKRRAEVLARTEVIRAHHAANMGEYRAAGAMGISVLAEHLTAGDGRVCPKCAPLNGKKYTLEEAEYIIPVHPQCRCVAIPYIHDDSPGRQVTPKVSEPVEFTPVKNLEVAQKTISDLFNVQVGEFGSFSLSKKEILQSVNVIGLELQRLENNLPGISKLTSKPRTGGTYSGRGLTVSVGDKNPGKGVGEGANLGIYDPKLNEINIMPIPKQTKTPVLGETYAWHSVYDDSLYSFRHEYAHAVHAQGLSQEAFEEWFFMYKAKERDFWERMVSEYGGVSAAELFSEAFAKYTCTEYKKGILPEEIEDFFEKHLIKK